ncbi:CYTH domain-containing protein [Alteribacter lacisalsi]|uniref:CYTH domain-containing protein n=1 Tax=Alteribacter lacisalsi TaxID=2045244 RepID=A0A2W0HJQ1_9BACI|nr:CYTH domain-containing protein [Alteribacter lacisalsi]PYZ97735.1 CYTH domain-containing protein [Alteribacter lacisalsi]
MNQEVEIEFKNLLNEEEYHRLRMAFFKNEEPFSQTNYYFDTKSYLLKDHGAMLRIREKAGSYILTLKQPIDTGLLETHQYLSDKEASTAFAGNGIPGGDVIEHLNKTVDLDRRDFRYLGSLTTERFERKIEGGLLVLDQSTYLDFTDYELEFECADETEGKKAFSSLLDLHKIAERETPSKSHRFFSLSQQTKRT